MIKAILLDMDNTLLRNPDRRFAAAFRAQWESHFEARCNLRDAAIALRGALQSLNSAADARRSNAQRMRAELARRLPLDAARLDAVLAEFYAERYPLLQPLVAPVSSAPELLEFLLRDELLVAIATNPLYPEAAIRLRLQWAGLGEFIERVDFITHSENMRFAKPSQEYYAETIARLGVEPDEAMMIGDSHANDIEPARALGLRAWHVTDDESLARVFRKLRETDWREEGPRPLRSDMILPQYRGNLGALWGLLDEVKPHQWNLRPDPEEWSILQILCHLWTTETAVHQSRLRTILEQDDPFLAASAPPGPHIPPCHDDGVEVMRRFQADREVAMQLLDALSPADWQRKARHSIFGLTNLLEMAHFTAQHDRLHITQLCQTLGKCAE